MAVRRKKSTPKAAPAAATPKPETVGPSELSAFAVTFFEFFGAGIQHTKLGKEAVIRVTLPPELAAHFTKPTLNLVFKNAEITSDTDLMAYGSRIFDRMMVYLERQGALTVRHLPKRFQGGEELLQSVQPTNAPILNLQLREERRDLLIFNWHITYRADDKREEIFSVVMDESGDRILLQEDGHPQGLSLARLLADSTDPPQEVDGDRGGDEQGQPIHPRLPPMTQLARQAQAARKYVLYHADLRCVDHEKEILPRLHKVLSRLTTYYNEQIEEVYEAHDPTSEKRQGLEEDLRRKIAEEVENHRLRVKVRLFSYAILHLPVAMAELTVGLARADAEMQKLTIRVWRNLYDGSLRRPACHACGQETTQITLDREGHITCDKCIQQCHTCQEILCAACGVVPCPVCAESNCDTCGHLCWACGERACPDHISGCPVCGDHVCHSCQTACAKCGVRQCRSHLRADAVDQTLICGECAIRCPGCHQYSAQTAICATSGQRFCTNCTAVCATCGQTFGPNYFYVAPHSRKIYCLEHTTTCKTCGKIAEELWKCSECGEESCVNCGFRCNVCQTPLCAAHAHTTAGCTHVTCAAHTATCAIGHESVCPVCAQPCAICDRMHCQAHTTVCRMCQQPYCQECVRISGLCDTCANVEKEGIRVRIQDEPVARAPEAAAVIRHYEWVRLANHRYTIYLGRGALSIQALMVARQGELLLVRRQSPLDRILGRGWS